MNNYVTVKDISLQSKTSHYSQRRLITVKDVSLQSKKSQMVTRQRTASTTHVGLAKLTA